MIKSFLLSIILISSTICFSQSDFTEIDKNSKIVPDSLTDYNTIAKYLINDLKKEKEKARAIYTWIAHNIQYDLSQINSGKRYESQQEIIDEVINDRKGICQHYSELFHAMSKSIGLKSYLIRGYTRDALGKIPDLGHAWNGIEIDSNYYLIDVTWSAGYLLNGKYVHKFRDHYFLNSPKEFIKDHMPFDPIFQFIDTPINNNDFTNSDFSKLNKKGTFPFKNLIDQHERSKTLIQLENSNNRIIENGIRNKLIQQQIDENHYEITSRKYNIGIDALNNGVNSYNLYLTHKNRKFKKPKLNDSRIKELIDDADNGITSASKIFHSLFSPNRDLSNLIRDAQKRMPDLIFDVEREKIFVDKYLKKWKPIRIFMF